MKRPIITTLIFLAFLGPYCREVCAQNKTHTKLYFADLYLTKLQSLKEAGKIKRQILSNTDELSGQAIEKIINCANFYFLAGTRLPAGDKTGVEYVKISLQLYTLAWKANMSDPRIRVLLATAHMSRGADPHISIEEILTHIFRARNLYSMVLNSYPENLDALLGRIRINMNLTPATGRADSIHTEDIKKYQAGYAKLSESEKENPYFKMGLMEVYLAEAILLSEKKETARLKKELALIEPSYLYPHVRKIYDNLKKDLKNQGDL